MNREHPLSNFHDITTFHFAKTYLHALYILSCKMVCSFCMGTVLHNLYNTPVAKDNTQHLNSLFFIFVKSTKVTEGLGIF